MKSTKQAIAELKEIRTEMMKVKGVLDMSGVLTIRDGEWFYFTYAGKQFAIDFNYEENTFGFFSANGTFEILPNTDYVEHKTPKQIIKRAKSILRIFKNLLED